MKIAGIWSGHDCAYYISENGKPIVHAEYERYIREKEPAGDAAEFMFSEHNDCQDIKYFASCYPDKNIKRHETSFQKMSQIANDNDGQIFFLGHHMAHAANAFFSSNFSDSLILTIDGGGLESQDFVSACTVWHGKDNKIDHVHTFPIRQVNIGGVWTRTTRYVFNLQSGWPRGHQAGTIMAMAAMGDPDRFREDFHLMLTRDIQYASFKPPEQPKGANVGTDPKHPYLYRWREIADRSEQDRFDVAAGIQSATEDFLKQLLGSILQQVQVENICLAGGVALNSVAVGKIKTWYPQIKDVYVTPTPHDGGLPIGAAQYIWHQHLGNPRIPWEDNFTPYLGYTYKNIDDTLEKYADAIETETSDDDAVVNLLSEGNIIAVFGDGSESGRRALGNRSILADPRNPNMKDMINEKVKHRQWFRPFAPSILREEVKNWFTEDKNSPYMSFVLKFKEDMKDKVPAVLHFDGSARLQTVTENDNKWYYNFIKKWYEVSGVPIVLNTSFNDREPICETAEHALNCFLRTNIDYLYFYNENVLVRKK